MSDLIEVMNLFEKYFSGKPHNISEISASGSNRRYWRMTDVGGRSVIGSYGPVARENRAFFEISKQLDNNNIPAPKVFAVSDNSLCYLQQDLGNTALFDFIKKGRETGVFDEQQVSLIKKTIALLPVLQFKLAIGLNFDICYPQSSFDKNNIFFDLNYFKYSFLKLSGVDFDEILLQQEFEKLSCILLKNCDTETFMFRDFQSRNVMIKDCSPYFIDFQGGRKGPIYYDVASFLWQAKANFPNSLRNELISTYLLELKKYHSISESKFLETLKYFVLFRQLQTLGAYGFRGIFEGKTHFKESIPLAINNAREILHKIDDFQYLKEIFDNKKLTDNFVHQSIGTEGKLTVQIQSFSFKKGLPKDESNNGGGYVFDCRGIHNPGRYDQYKQLTGLDSSVKSFLTKNSDVDNFLEHVFELVNSHIDVYLERKFSHLCVFFGCTGGQHRSVYCAETLSEYLKNSNKNLIVHTTHRELKNAKMV